MTTPATARLLKALLPLALPFAVLWCKWHESRILRHGVPLHPAQLRLAGRLAIKNPDAVRLLKVPRVPPSAPLTLWMGQRLGILDKHQGTIGMTLGYGIYIHQNHWDEPRLIAHELAHVAQYERLGGFGTFLKLYLTECIDPGYPRGPLEQEAKAAERGH